MVSRMVLAFALVCLTCLQGIQAANLRRLVSLTDVVNQMLTAINNERANNGLSALCYNYKLIAAAQAHSEDQANTGVMSHTGSDGSSLGTRIDRQGFNWSAIAENVAAGQTSVSNVVAAWMNSEGHRLNILGSYKFLGVGYGYNSNTVYKTYWTLDFGASSTETCDASQTDLYTCEIENGVDYSGNDVGSVANVANPRDCFGVCEVYSGCNAFTWTSYNGGTCWLKSAKGTTASSSGAQSGTLCTSSCGRLEVNIDYPGNDLGSVKVTEANGCYNTCRYWNGCSAFSWTSYDSGTCWLKSAKPSQTTSSSGTQSGSLCPSGCGRLEVGMNYSGNDLGSVASSDVNGCYSACRNWNGCNAFTWNNYNGGTCWLKSGRGATAAQSGVQSAILCH